MLGNVAEITINYFKIVMLLAINAIINASIIYRLAGIFILIVYKAQH